MIGAKTPGGGGGGKKPTRARGAKFVFALRPPPDQNPVYTPVQM